MRLRLSEFRKIVRDELISLILEASPGADALGDDEDEDEEDEDDADDEDEEDEEEEDDQDEDEDEDDDEEEEEEEEDDVDELVRADDINKSISNTWRDYSSKLNRDDVSGSFTVQLSFSRDDDGFAVASATVMDDGLEIEGTGKEDYLEDLGDPATYAEWNWDPRLPTGKSLTMPKFTIA